MLGHAVKVAYLGGSITKQEGWRVHSLNWFKERFPNASCNYLRMNYFIVDGLDDKKHTEVLRSLCEPVDKTAILANKEYITKNPDGYKPNNLYIGKILIEGKNLK